jgi:D-alanyl-lipoteichoic acid acyltransferase DltB (MBOAT superfamily)
MLLIQRKSQTLFWTAISVDLGLLAFFKYFYLLAESLGSLISSPYLTSLHKNWVSDYNFEIILPIAISFYTFQIVAFVVDSYRGTIYEKISLRHYYVFILFFPQFVAGPIMRSVDFLPQIDKPTINKERLLSGIFLLLSGIIKKVLLADRLGAITGPIWHNTESYDAVFLILIIPAFIAQIYMDFSGYTDMARGMAFALGYDIPENFRAPLLSRSMTELWSRWHITLSTWLRDYIYIPLGGSRGSQFFTIRNVMITMALGGIWHGATWNMLFWGIYLGLLLSMERIYTYYKLPRMPDNSVFNMIRIVRTFALFSISALFFVPQTFTETLTIVGNIIKFQRGIPGDFNGILGMTIAGFLMNYFQLPGFYKLSGRMNYYVRYGLAIFLFILTAYLVLLFGDVGGSFIYFQF